MKKIISHNEKETLSFGQSYAKELKGGEVLALFGDLGAGKTVFAKGLAKGLGLKTKVNSPTFNILKLYSSKGVKKIKYFCHVDAYRLGSASDLEAIGIKDFMREPGTVVLIEWAEKIKSLLPRGTKKIYIKHLHDNLREIKY